MASTKIIDKSEKYSDKISLSYKNSTDEWISQTWSEFYNSVQSISKSLIASGIEKNDKVSIYSYNRIEWVECYAATQLINSAAVGVYHTCSSNEVEWIVNNSDSKIIFVGHNPNDNGEEEKMPIVRLQSILDKIEFRVFQFFQMMKF